MSALELPSSTASKVSAWVRRTRELLALEHGEERVQLEDKLTGLSSKLCEAEGLSLLHLEVESVRSGLYGRSVVVLQRLDKQPLPPSCSFKVGDEVRLYVPKLQAGPEAESSQVEGVVSKVATSQLEMVLTEQRQVTQAPRLPACPPACPRPLASSPSRPSPLSTLSPLSSFL